MDYFKGLNAAQKKNISIINQQMVNAGITNPYTRAAILAVSSKESGFIPQSEKSYKNTSNERIRSIFNVSDLTDDQLNTLKQNDEDFFNYVYGNRYGNADDEGYKYRGRGFNQLTFKSNYESVGKRLGLDLVNNPDLVNQPDFAAKVMIDFFVKQFKVAKASNLLSKFNTTDINGFKNITDSTQAVFQANRGWAKTSPDTTGGYQLAVNRAPGFLDFISENKGKISFGLVLLTGLTIYFLNKA